MAIKLHGLSATLSTFREVDRRCTDMAKKVIEKGAKDIADRARKFAPVDKHDLEKAIRAERSRETGAFKWLVTVKDRVGGRNVGEYAWRVHETMRPAGRGLRQGMKSREKSRQLGVTVGGGFLQRAFDSLEKHIGNELRRALAGEMNRMKRRPAIPKKRKK